MLKKIKMSHDNIDLEDLNIILLLLSIIPYFISLIYGNNIIVIILLYLLNFELFYHLKKIKWISFLNYILPIIIIGYIFLSYLDLSFIQFDILKIVNYFIKFILGIYYLVNVFLIVKDRKIKYIKGRNRLHSHTLNELRKSNINKFYKNNLEYQEKYMNDLGIKNGSDYYKVINNNVKNKTINELEEYVTLNYLRFYKNKKYNKRNVFDKLNIVFIGIHVIILLLVFLVR